MAVSKRLRFEIFRRDNFTCRYCGEAAPDVRLTVDHVIPDALGGTDEPSNLVTACADCNSGKTSVAPDAPLVDDVSQDALRWGRAMERAAAIQADEQERFQAFLEWFHGEWDYWTVGPDKDRVPLPTDYTQSLHRFFQQGLDPDFIAYAVTTSMQAPTVKVANTFRYFAGICWRHIEERQQIAMSLIEAEEDAQDG